MPKITVICLAYNHEKYIGETIRSVLNQTEQDFEMIVIDDCSMDKTAEVAESFTDERIKVIRNAYNKGPNANMSMAAGLAKGEFLTFIGSDDMYFNTHFEVTTKYLSEHPDTDVFYCRLQAVDENGAKHPYFDSFVPFSASREEALRKMFYTECVFPSPGMIFRRSSFMKICPLCASLVNCQDYWIHIRILINGNFYQSPEPLVYYRRHAGNLSKESLVPFIRPRYETSTLMDAFSNMSAGLINDVFEAELKELNLTATDDNKPFVLGMLALRADNEYRRLWGYARIVDFMNKNGHQLYDEYGFDFKRLLGLTENIVNQFHQKELHKGEAGWFEKFFYRMYHHLEKKRLSKIR